MIDLNQVIKDIAGSYDIAKMKELEMFEERRQELLKQQQEQQHQASQDEISYYGSDINGMEKELNFND
jgi:hypothetical protein|tara:strand:+ start:230 stop:433 length:204 start_codon:yes stop_codon:yes gene_type:complete